MGIDPITHKSKTAINTNVSHMTQWENTRLEAEARLVRGCKVVSNFCERIHCGSSHLINKQMASLLSLPQPLYFDVLKARQGISKLSNLSGLETPNDQTTPVMNGFESVGSQVLKEYRMNGWETSKDSFNTLENLKDEGNQNTLTASDMIYQDGYLSEVFTTHLVNDTSNKNCHPDFEEDINYWRNILDKLG